MAFQERAFFIDGSIFKGVFWRYFQLSDFKIHLSENETVQKSSINAI